MFYFFFVTRMEHDPWEFVSEVESKLCNKEQVSVREIKKYTVQKLLQLAVDYELTSLNSIKEKQLLNDDTADYFIILGWFTKFATSPAYKSCRDILETIGTSSFEEVGTSKCKEAVQLFRITLKKEDPELFKLMNFDFESLHHKCNTAQRKVWEYCCSMSCVVYVFLTYYNQ